MRMIFNFFFLLTSFDRTRNFFMGCVKRKKFGFSEFSLLTFLRRSCFNACMSQPKNLAILFEHGRRVRLFCQEKECAVSFFCPSVTPNRTSVTQSKSTWGCSGNNLVSFRIFPHVILWFLFVTSGVLYDWEYFYTFAGKDGLVLYLVVLTDFTTMVVLKKQSYL